MNRVDIRTLEQEAANLTNINESIIRAAKFAGRDFTTEETARFDGNMGKIEALRLQIRQIDRKNRQQETREEVQPANNPGASTGSAEVLDKPKFKSLGEQLIAVARFEKTKGMTRDPRLIAVGSPEYQFLAGPAGMNEAVPAEGGFLVQGDVAEGLLLRVYETGELLDLCQPLEISATSNRLEINGIDEQSRANGSRFGGVQAFWSNEAGALTSTKPKFRKIALFLNKLIALCYATDEMVADAQAMESVINNVFPQEFSFRMEDAIINGLGNGQPLGILNSPALITVPKVAGQATATLVAQNVMTMWSRCWGRSRKKAVWLIDQSIEPQLFQFTLPTAAGISTPIYLPPGGLSASPYGTLFGRPVIPTEYNAALGSVGDVILVDFSQYVLARKSVLQAASSMHVNFLTDEMAYRFTLRLDGQPSWNTALTPKSNSGTLSPYITLAARP